MQTRSKILIVAALALLVPALLIAQAAEKHMEHMGMGMHGDAARHIIHALDLTPDQVKQVKTVFANHKAEIQTELAALKTDRGALFDAIHADTLDETAIRTAATALGQAEADLGVTRAKILGEARQVLNPDQQAKLKDLLTHAKGFGEKIFYHIESHLADPLAGN
jgi:Spy/CpxP family protein refolding chaperone